MTDKSWILGLFVCLLKNWSVLLWGCGERGKGVAFVLLEKHHQILFVRGSSKLQTQNNKKLPAPKRDTLSIVIATLREKHPSWHYWTNSSRPLLMLDVLDYLLRSFNESTDWNHDNFYSNLTTTSKRTFPLSLSWTDSRLTWFYDSKGVEVTYCFVLGGSIYGGGYVVCTSYSCWIRGLYVYF